MRSFSTAQQTAIEASAKLVTWLFDVTTAAGVTYYWSTKTYDNSDPILDHLDDPILDHLGEAILSGNTYTFKIPPESFSGFTLARARSEQGVHAPCSLQFAAINASNAMSHAGFIDGTVRLRLIINDAEILNIMWWIRNCQPGPQKLEFTCEELVQRYLRGDWPNTKLTKEIWPETEPDPADNICLPVVVGDGYVPLRSAYITGAARYYVLGPADEVYHIKACSSPRAIGGSSEWSYSQFAFPMSVKAAADGSLWRVMQPIISDANSDGVADSPMFWLSGNAFAAMPCRFSTDETAALSNPADWLDWVLQDMGCAYTNINTGTNSTFAACAAAYITMGIDFEGGYWQRRGRAKVLAELLVSCRSTIDQGSQIELRLLSNVIQPVKTGVPYILAAHIVARTTGNVGLETTYRYDDRPLDTESDSLLISYQQDGKPQDTPIETTVPATSTTVSQSGTVVSLPLIKSSVVAQKLGTLAAQLLLLKKGELSFTGRPLLLGFQPGDFAAVQGGDYGGTVTFLIDSMLIRANSTIDFKGLVLREDVTGYDWNNLNPSAVVPVADQTSTIVQAVLSGPNSTPTNGVAPNAVVNNVVLGAGGSLQTIGKSTYLDNTAGFWVGDYSAAYRLFFGDATRSIKFNGSDVLVYGSVLAGSEGEVITGFSDDGTMADDSPQLGVTQHAVKTYADNAAGAMLQEHAETTGGTHGIEGDFVGTTDIQTISNKTLDQPTVLTPTISDPVLNGSLAGTAFLDEDDMASNAGDKTASQKSIKAYADGKLTAHLSAYVHGDIAHDNRDQLNLVTDGDHDVRTDNPHTVSASQLVSGTPIAAETLNFEATISGNVTSITLSNGIIISRTILP